jgi:peroxiredoxin
VKSWASSPLVGPSWRQNLIRLALAAILVGTLLWMLPARRHGPDGGHHAGLDPFERAGVSELQGGQRGPDFLLQRFDGGSASGQTWRDSLVILNFWATWCTPCTVEMPTLEALWRTWRRRGLVVVAISVDRGGPRELIGPYLQNLGLTFPVLMDPDARTAERWQVTGLPTTFIVRPGGEVVGMARGPREWDSAEMRALLAPLLPPAGKVSGP